MKSFKASAWDSDADDDSYQEMFKESSKRKKDRSKLIAAKDEKKQKKLEKLLKKQFRDFNTNDVNFITVQTKIELGKNKREHSPTGSFETSKKEKVRKRCKKSKTSDSEDSDEEVTKKQKKMLKKYSSELNTLNGNSDKLLRELLKEKKRQRKLQRRLEKATKKEMVRAIESKIVDNFEDAVLKKIKEEPMDEPIVKPVIKPRKPGILRGPDIIRNPDNIPKLNIIRKLDLVKRPNIIQKPDSSQKPDIIRKPDINRKPDNIQKPDFIRNPDAVTKKQPKEKINSDINIPESLRIAKKIQLQEKLKTILSQVQKRENKPVLTLRQKMMEKLKAARFRFLNEQIYTTDSKEAQRIFNSDPEAFIAYHEGYRQQVRSWPMNPLQIIIKSIRTMPKTHVVADFGCGDAKLSKFVHQKVHSFDLVAIDDSVIACDMANVPLKDATVDVGVFCLSLMGTNIHDYILEANRVLKVGGILKIAEVESRFGNIDSFIEGIQHFGFKKIWKDLSHNLFYFIDFKKVKNVKNKKKLPTISLLPCLYKKR